MISNTHTHRWKVDGREKMKKTTTATIKNDKRQFYIEYDEEDNK